jgi:hypothetical protein
VENADASVLDRATDCSVRCGGMSSGDRGAPLWIGNNLILGEGNDISSGNSEAYSAPAVVDQVRKAWVRWIRFDGKASYHRKPNIRICLPQMFCIIRGKAYRNNDFEWRCILLREQSVDAALRVGPTKQRVDYHRNPWSALQLAHFAPADRALIVPNRGLP